MLYRTECGCAVKFGCACGDDSACRCLHGSDFSKLCVMRTSVARVRACVYASCMPSCGGSDSESESHCAAPHALPFACNDAPATLQVCQPGVLTAQRRMHAAASEAILHLDLHLGAGLRCFDSLKGRKASNTAGRDALQWPRERKIAILHVAGGSLAWDFHRGLGYRTGPAAQIGQSKLIHTCTASNAIEWATAGVSCSCSAAAQSACRPHPIRHPTFG